MRKKKKLNGTKNVKIKPTEGFVQQTVILDSDF